MTITITAHNNNPGLPAYQSLGLAAAVAVAAGGKFGGMAPAGHAVIDINGNIININGGININNHVEAINIVGNFNLNVPQDVTMEVHNNSSPLIIQGNMDLRFSATSTPHGVTLDSGSNITLQSQSTHGLDLVINDNNVANPTTVTLTAGAVSSMIVNVGQNQYTIKDQEDEPITFGEFNAQEFDELSQYIIDNYDPVTGEVYLFNHQGELLSFKKYSKLLENAKVWDGAAFAEDFWNYEPQSFLLSAAEFINSHWLELNGVNMNQTNFESIPQEVMGYLAEYIADGDIH